MQNIFEIEVKEKKQQKHALAAKSNGRRKSNFMLPTDYMDKAQRDEYMKAGEIVTTNLWDQILTKTQYNELSDEKKKFAMEHWYKRYKTAEIKNALGYSDYQLYKEWNRIGVEYEKRPNRTRKAKVTAAKKDKPAANIDHFEPEGNKPLDIKEIEEKIEQKQQATTVTVMPAANSGSVLYMDDTLDSEAAITKLMKYAAFLEGESNKFRLRIEISEVKQGEK